MVNPGTDTRLMDLTYYRDEISRQLANIRAGIGVSKELAEARIKAEEAAANLMQEIERLILPVLAPAGEDAGKPVSNENILEAERFLKLHTALKNSGMLREESVEK